MPPAISQESAASTRSELPGEKTGKCCQSWLRALSDVELLACFIWGEARGEKIEGKLAIVHVVLNKVKAQFCYGQTIRDVILKLGHFTGPNPNLLQTLRIPPGDMEFALCKAISELATRGHLKNDPTDGATHFHRVDSKPPWVPKLTYLRQIGNHVFYRESLNPSREDQGLTVHKRGNGREL